MPDPLAAATSRTLALSDRGVEIALLDWGGDGPLALLHHANGFCAGLWGLVALRLRERYRVVAFDARGHGDSSAPENPDAYRWSHFADDLVAVADALVREDRADGGGEVALGLGHSFGGTSMIAAASGRTGLFRRIVLADPVMVPPREEIPPEMRGGRNPMVERARRRRSTWPSRDEARASWTREGHPFARWRPEALELYLQAGLRDRDDGQVELKCRPSVEAAVFENNGSLDVFDCARKLETPTRILWASEGNFQRATYERFAALAADCTIEDVAAGHLLPMEVPDVVAERALAFGAG